MTARIKFCGAAETVTGSCYLVELSDCRFLVDCGMFQGTKTLRELNYGAFAFAPSEIDFVLLTHAHIDHSGLIPKLTRQGFEGPVFTTSATRDLLTYMLPDSGYIQEMEVRRINRRNGRRGNPGISPIYTRADAEDALDRIEIVSLGDWFAPATGVRVRLWNAGHILGAASVEVEIAASEKKGRPLRILFSGDIGPQEKALHPDPDAPSDLDYVLVESTYGDRERSDLSPEARRAVLRVEVEAALAAGGNLIIPSFAVERTQELIFDLGVLMDEGLVSKVPVFLDSPLAIRATEVFEAHVGELDGITAGRQPFRNENLQFVLDTKDSIALEKFKTGVIIMSASGMCDAGRIRHHLKNNLNHANATILFVGYQAPGSLGALICGGAKKVRIHGEEIAVKARVRKIDVYSAHADRGELVAWVKKRMPVRGGVFLTHGEHTAMDSLAHALSRVGIDGERIFTPRLDETFELVAEGRPQQRIEKPRLEAERMGPTDWHNDYAVLLLDLAEELRHLPDDVARRNLLAAMRRVLPGEARTGPA